MVMEKCSNHVLKLKSQVQQLDGKIKSPNQVVIGAMGDHIFLM